VTAEISAGGGQAFPCRLELSDTSSIHQAVQEVVDRFGGLDILVANAVRWPNDAAGPLADVSWEAWQEAVRINLEGTVDTVRAAILTSPPVAPAGSCWFPPGCPARA